MFDLDKLKGSSQPVDEYLSSSSQEEPSFAVCSMEYRLDLDVAERLKRYAREVVIFAFSAEWCPDCQKIIPVLGLISEATGIEVRIFGHLMRDPMKPRGFWKIPPSPIEVEEFQVRKIPTIIVIDSSRGIKVGEIIEKPPEGKTLEETLLYILETNKCECMR
ncbi:MAG: thioredoxin family protein [Candidatus Bathyarchaeota archaeon]|jgi:thiol-disulfide isomerase/thioredoxin